MLACRYPRGGSGGAARTDARDSRETTARSAVARMYSSGPGLRSSTTVSIPSLVTISVAVREGLAQELTAIIRARVAASAGSGRPGRRLRGIEPIGDEVRALVEDVVGGQLEHIAQTKLMGATTLGARRKMSRCRSRDASASQDRVERGEAQRGVMRSPPSCTSRRARVRCCESGETPG